VGGHGALLSHEGAEEIDRIGRADVLERHDLGQDLVARAHRVDVPSDHGPHGRLRCPLAGDDPVEIARAHGGQAVDVEDGQQHVEDVVAGDLAGGLDRDLPPPRLWRQHVVEPHDLGGRLDHDLHVGIVEVENDVAGTRGARGRRRREL
jgi:hypothetical protein